MKLLLTHVSWLHHLGSRPSPQEVQRNPSRVSTTNKKLIMDLTRSWTLIRWESRSFRETYFHGQSFIMKGKLTKLVKSLDKFEHSTDISCFLSLGKWVAAINTNPKALENNDISEASRALKGLTAPNEEHARALAMLYTPPKMLPFEDHPRCFTCNAKFTLFRRACHCRNCGVCNCNSCSVHWPARMIPSTYNTKNESRVSICKSCDTLSNVFRLALMQGSYEQTMRVFSTKNVNAITPFMQGKGEIMYPIHVRSLCSA